MFPTPTQLSPRKNSTKDLFIFRLIDSNLDVIIHTSATVD